MDDSFLHQLVVRANRGEFEGKGKVWIHFNNGSLGRGEFVALEEYRAWIVSTYEIPLESVNKVLSKDPTQMVLHFKGAIFTPAGIESPMLYWRIALTEVQTFSFETPSVDDRSFTPPIFH